MQGTWGSTPMLVSPGVLDSAVTLEIRQFQMRSHSKITNRTSRGLLWEFCFIFTLEAHYVEGTCRRHQRKLSFRRYF